MVPYITQKNLTAANNPFSIHFEVRGPAEAWSPSSNIEIVDEKELEA